MNIIRNTRTVYHNTSAGRQTPKYIVMHYTASNGGTGANHISYFSNLSTTNASADYFVDEVGIYEYNNQIGSRYTWAVGDGSGGTYGGRCYNSNQISVEMCCYQSGGRWYISDDTYKNAVQLVKYLMAKYKIPASNVIRHYDVSCKLCPNAVGWLKSTGSETTWNKFKSEIAGSTANNGNQTAVTNTDTIYRVRKSWQDTKSQIGAWKNLNSAKTQADKNKGYSVFDKNGNLIYTPMDINGNYKVKITADVLNVRSGAGTTYPIKTVVHMNEIYTIVSECNGWGKLKSGAGWICLDYTEKI